MDIFHTIILSIIEGITEFLPVSSTGHLLLVSGLLKIPASSFLSSFTIAIQLGAILSVVVLFWKKLTTSLEPWKKIIVAFIPTAIIGLIFYAFIINLLSKPWIALVGIIGGGFVMIGVEYMLKRRWEREDGKESGALTPYPLPITYKGAFLIGLFQAIAFIPGVSRSAATIVGGLLLGISRKTVVEFSFLLAIPTMAAATGLDLLKSSHNFTRHEWLMMACGFAVSFFVALAVMKWLLRYIEKYTFIPFGVYRIVFGVVMVLVLFA